MIKKLKKLIPLLLTTTMVIFPLTVRAEEKQLEKNQTINFQNKYTLEEQKLLRAINPQLTSIPEVLELKENGYLDELIEELDSVYTSEYNKEVKDKLTVLASWDLTPEMTISQLKEYAQNYLDKNYDGILIDSVEFKELVSEMFYGDSYPLSKMAKENPDFGALYLYMCIYYDENYDEASATLSKNSKITNSGETLKQIITDDFNKNFRETTSMVVLHEVEEQYLEQRAPKNPLDGDKIQEYARRYGNSYNTANYVTQSSDCTNFASQALFYGLLPKTFYSSDKTANGYVDTTSRWFYFNNTSSSKYSASTSWVRVVDLYSYLSPNYAVFETSSGSQMTPYVNKGFILQGKHFIGSYSHTIIATKGKDGSILYCGHSNFRKDEPIQTFYDAYSKYRVIQVY